MLTATDWEQGSHSLFHPLEAVHSKALVKGF